MNNHGRIGGHITRYDQDQCATAQAFVWDSRDGLKTLEAPNVVDSRGFDINDDGQVLGLCTTSANRKDVFIWEQDGSLHLLNLPGASGVGRPYINNNGLVATSYRTTGTAYRLATWQKDRGWKHHDGFGPTVYIQAVINDTGHILLWDNSPGIRVANRHFFESHESWLFTTEGKRTRLTNMLPVGKGKFFATDLNNHGWILGGTVKEPHDYYILIPIK